MKSLNHTVWKNKRVLVTGHTGFKGGWLTLWLKELGAEIHGVALEPPTQPNFFKAAHIASLLVSDHRADIRHFTELNNLIKKIQPEIVFHLAAQSLVRTSYDFPIETYATNVMGTVHVLESVRHCPSIRACVVVTTDKCYENHESISPYRETDRLGGVDPYSSSKACAELITSAYRASFFSTEGNVKIATARAGNVIGGGDWGENRLVPDCMRAFVKEKNLNLRYPQAVRPWQHVLEPIYGYLLLAENLLSEEGQYYTESWNFGPEYTDIKTVEEVARQISTYLNITIEQDEQTEKKHEASLLHLDSTKVKERLHWFPRWDLSEAIKYTVKWYQEWMQGKDMLHFSRVQLAQYAGKMIND